MNPLSAAILVAATGFAFSFGRMRRTGQAIIASALLALWVAGTPICADWLTWRLEAQFAPVSIGSLPYSDAVIVLGGIIGQPIRPRASPDLGDTVDRIIEALRIYRAGKVPRIVISAGNQPEQAKLVPEAELIADFLVELGVPRSALILETRSRNTHENAVYTAAIFREHGWRSALLVTSGIHMPRAMASFGRQAINVYPASTDIHGAPIGKISIMDLFPEPGSLARTTSALREMIGLQIYRFRGWA